MPPSKRRSSSTSETNQDPSARPRPSASAWQSIDRGVKRKWKINWTKQEKIEKWDKSEIPCQNTETENTESLNSFNWNLWKTFELK